jgi:hypothetical protein
MNAKRCGSYAVLLFIACLPCFAAQSTTPPQQQASDIRAQLWAVDYRHYRDLDDYLSRCERVRDLLPSLESFYKWSDTELERLREKHRDNPELVKLGDVIASLNSLDEAGLRLLRKEMVLASKMSSLPSDKRQAFFDQNIRPTQKAEDELSEQEVQMAQKARRDGVHLPDFIVGVLGEAR